MKLARILALCILAALFCACDNRGAETRAKGDVIKVGVFLPLTGPNAFGGQLELEGIKLAHKEWGEVLGKRVELVIEDNKSDKAVAAEVVRKLITEDKVTAIIGTYGSSLALAGGEVAEKLGIPVMGTSCTNPRVTEGKQFYFRACFVDPFQGAAAAAYAYNQMELRRAAVIVDRASDYSVGLAGYFIRAFRALGGSIVANEKYRSGDSDFQAQLAAINNADPEILFMPAYFNEGVQILMQARAGGAKFIIMGGDAMDNPTTTTLAKEVVEGFMHTAMPYDRNMPSMNPIARKFTSDWLAVYDKEPNANSAVGYNAYQLIMEGIGRARSTNPKAVAQALSGIKDLPGVMGSVTINASHNAEMPVGIIAYKDNRRVFLDVINPGAQDDSLIETHDLPDEENIEASQENNQAVGS